jgi:hypothetical protein
MFSNVLYTYTESKRSPPPNGRKPENGARRSFVSGMVQYASIY